MTSAAVKTLRDLPWLLLAVPGALQVILLASAIGGRVAYPYDLEWMEGGLLVHAQRLVDGHGIYVEPSVDFIPYLYTPLYPTILATLGKFLGVSYGLGRAISVLAMIAVLALAAAAVVRAAAAGGADSDPGAAARRRLTAAAWCGAALAAGFLAASYPFVDGWYDLVRADTLFLAIVLAGILMVAAWGRRPGLDGHLRIAGAAAVLALSFYCKQTGVLFVAAGGAIVLFLDWRKVPAYVIVAGLIGLGGTFFLNRASDGWFWTYAYEVHQAHDFNWDRVRASFRHILLQFPLMTLAPGLAIVAAGAAAARARRIPPGAGTLLLWSALYLFATVVGAVSWGTQWAHFNAYIPAMATGAVAAGAAVPALAGAFHVLRPALAPYAAMLLAAGLGAQLLSAWWSPSSFVPEPEDRIAGDRLIAEIRAVDGEVFVPYHPWYAALAGKRTYVHRMGLMDIRFDGPWEVAGLTEALSEHRFAAVFLDNRPVGRELRELPRSYQRGGCVPRSARPRVYSGAGARHKPGEWLLVPEEVWVPATAPRKPESGARILFDFERGDLEGWTATGTAWGRGPVERLPGLGPVRCHGGRRFLTSFHGGDAATGTLESPPFTLDGDALRFLISGGRDPERLRAELHVQGKVVHSATSVDNSDRMERVTWDVSAHRGKEARLVLVDEATGSWGHLNIDEVFLLGR